ncbi:MAG: hypothetical protein JXR84_24115 [Anaerolineae bacterium]|nr:hypothetical protein [Anaerolineae bacterium]
MPQNPVIPIVITWLHNLFTAVWLGGLAALAWAVLPAVRRTLGAKTETKALMSAIQKRLSTAVYISIVGLWLTGLLITRRAGSALFQASTPYGIALMIKHILVLLMVAVSLLRSFGIRLKALHITPKRQMALLILNVVLGVLVLGATAALSVLPGPN